MCWNAEISLNTFIFSFFMLLFIAYNNNYTKYKIQELNNQFAYIFIFSIISIQLLEYFLWKNITNKRLNKILSTIGTLIIYMQPIAALFLMNDVRKRNFYIFIYLCSFPFLIYKMTKTHPFTFISKKGHLQWNWPNMDGFDFMYIIFLFLPLIVNKLYTVAIITAILLFLSIYLYRVDNSYKSLWCWYSNLFMIIYACKLLIYLPYKLHTPLDI